MIIKLFRGLTGVDEVHGVTQNIVCDDEGNPIAIITSPSEGVCMISTINDDNFYDQLRANGLKYEKKLRVKELQCPRH